MRIINWFKTPYFFDPTPKINLIIAFGIGFFIFLFLFAFKPFGMSELRGNLFIYCVGFGVITFLVQSTFYIFLPIVFKSFFKDDKWTIGKNILFLLILVTSISFCNWFYNNQVQNTKNWRLLNLEEIFSYTFSVAIFPVFILTYFSEKLYRLKYEKISKEIMNFKVLTKTKKVDEKIIITGENKKEEISFNLNNLVYITSQGNYASFYLKTKNGLKENIIRNTLNNITLDLKKYTNIIRCHKSYIVNATFMDTISGNARGYFLQSKLVDKPIPVSRKIKKEVLRNLINKSS